MRRSATKSFLALLWLATLAFPSAAGSDRKTSAKETSEDARLRTIDELVEKIAARPGDSMLSEISELRRLITRPVVYSHARWAFSLVTPPALREEHKERYLSDEELRQVRDRPYLYEMLAMRRSLGEDRFRRAVEVFIVRLGSTDPRIKEKAAWFLGWALRAQEAADELVEAGSSSADSGVRLAVAEGLGCMGDTRANQFLTPFIEGESDLRRLRAARIWADGAGLAQPLSISVAQRLIDSEDSRVVRGALDRLDNWLMAKRLVGSREEKTVLIDAVTSLAAKVPERTARFAVRALSSGRSYFASEKHVDLCVDKVWKRYGNAGPVLKAAILTMEARLRPERCIDHLILGLEESHPVIVRRCAIKLGILYEKGLPSIPYLALVLDHPTERVRVSAALAILRILGKIKEAPPGDVVQMAREELLKTKAQQ